MKRRAINWLTLLSALLCAATAALWGRSHLRSEAVHFGSGGTEATWWSETGQMGFNRAYPGEVGAPAQTGLSFHSIPAEPREDHGVSAGQQFRYRALGFEVSSYRPVAPTASGARMRYWIVAIPHWFAVGAFAVPPALWLWRRRRIARAARAGRCARCGYDLRASPDRCPECGAPSPLPSAAQ